MLLPILTTALLVSTALAQTPDGFTPVVKAKLDVIYPSVTVTPGQLMTKAATANQPIYGTTDVALNSTYILLMIDTEGPGESFGGAKGSRVTILHALLTNFKSSGVTKNGTHIVASKDITPTAYMGPAPPAETPAHSHRYVELLYEQPADFAVPAAFKTAISSRLGFDHLKFATASGLSDPVRANWFNVTS